MNDRDMILNFVVGYTCAVILDGRQLRPSQRIRLANLLSFSAACASDPLMDSSRLLDELGDFFEVMK